MKSAVPNDNEPKCVPPLALVQPLALSLSHALSQLVALALPLALSLILLSAQAHSETLPKNAPEKTMSLGAFYSLQYKAYPAEVATPGPKGKLKWETDKKAKKYRTRLLSAWAEAKEPNFAGHYFAVSDIGCGTGCAVIFVVDWSTGDIFYPPRDDAFSVTRNSRLMILKGYPECTAYGPPILYEFIDHQFKEIEHSFCK